MSGYFDQSSYPVRFEWGAEGVRALATASDVVIVVDVLSFSTAVEVAVERGAAVYPYHRHDDSAVAYARQRDAMLAVSRGDTTPEHPLSLSPATLRGLAAGQRLVLPSPNGATLSLLAAERSATVLAGCLRNATATARAAATLGPRITVIAAGERWPDDSLRPAIEDQIAAGAILTALDPTEPSPEARIAMAAFAGAAPRLHWHLTNCASGRELRELGYGDDVEIAAELDAGYTAPILQDGAFVRWSASG